MSKLPATYVLPLRSSTPRADLTDYLAGLSRTIDVMVVDGSPAEVFAAHRDMWPREVCHLPVDEDLGFANGKVNGVVTALRRATHDRVVVADDDVRYGVAELTRVVEELDRSDVVIPQNYFVSLPWHARWDTARTLLNRAVAHDYPGTLAVRPSVVPTGYDGDVLFENLELIRTAVAGGGRVANLPDLFVARETCSAAHFRGQRVRQAYDSLAQPARLAAELAILPGAIAVGRRHGLRGVGVLALASVALAEIGRRRASGRAVFPASTTLFAPAWTAERAVCIWIAVASRFLRGGVRYGDVRLRRAATPERVLRDRSAQRRPARSAASAA